MAKATKSKPTRTNVNTNKAEARPVGQGKDPLAEGNTLVNPTNSEAETHYDVKERSDDVRAAANRIDGQDANERAEQHNAEAQTPPAELPNGDAGEQDAVAEGRTEEPAPEAETPAEETTEAPAEEASEPEAPAEPAANPEPTPEV